MKKVLIVLAVLALAIGGIGLYYAGKMDGMIEQAIEVSGTKALGTAIAVDSVDTKIADGEATISGLTIANPPGYSTNEALSIQSLSAQVDYKAQTVKRVSINDTTINAELKGRRSNFQEILDSMPPREANENNAEGPDQKFQIDVLEMRNAKINVTSEQAGQASFIMDDFVLRDLSGTVSELSDQITQSLISHVSNQIKGHAQDRILEMAKEEATKRAKELAAKKLSDQGEKQLQKKLGDRVKNFNIKVD